MPTALYVCYFNTEEPLVQTQVLPYLRAIAASGVKTHLLTFERSSGSEGAERDRRRVLRNRLAEQGIAWHALRYHKRPSLLATTWDVLAGIVASVWILSGGRSVRPIVHARSHVAGLVGLAVKGLLGAKLIFDLRGLLAEEYVDNGIWKAGSLPYRMVKVAERRLLASADHVIVLTSRLKAQLTNGARAEVEPSKISVIPCCVDLSLYRRPSGGGVRHGRSARPLTLVYVGSTEGRYRLGEMADFFLAVSAKLGGARLRIVTRASRSRVEAVLESRGIDLRNCSVVSASPEEVPALLDDADVGMFFIRSTPALDGASPTKIGEYLAAGIPVVSSLGVGDTDTLLRDERVGVVVPAFTTEAYQAAVSELSALLDDPQTRARCRDAAERLYSLADVGEPRYRKVYDLLAGSTEPADRS